MPVDSSVNAFPKKKNLSSLQVFRGFAAMAVVFYHVYIILMEPQYGENVIFQPVARYGFLGVSFFFVLSGFIILMAHKKDVARPKAVPLYAFKRAARVYPAYWVYSTAFILAAAAGLGYPDFSWDPVNLISAYLLYNYSEEATLPLKVAWTLVYEMRFYVFFIPLILFGWRFLWAFWAWGIVILGLFAFKVPVPDVLSLWNIYFIAGMIGFLVLDRLTKTTGTALFLVGVVLALVYGYLAHDVERISDLHQNRPELHLILAPCFFALVTGVVAIEKNFDLSMPAILRFLGDASYSIYLVHSAAISALVIIFKKLDLFERFGYYPSFLMFFVIATIVGALAYMVVERPIVNIAAKIAARIKARTLA